MKSFSRVEILVLLLVVALFSPRPAFAQEGEPDETAEIGFGETVEVNVVNVDVYVTSKDGKPVTDLEPKDFEILEDGKPMKLTNFYAVEGGRKVAEMIDPEAGTVVPVSPREMELLAIDRPRIDEEERLRLVVYIDNFNIRPNERARILGHLRYFVNRSIGRDDQVMLVSYDRSLKVRQPFTSDPFLVGEALRELEEVRAEGNKYDRLRMDILEEIQKTSSSTSALSDIRPFADSILFDIQNTMGGLRELVDLLAGLPGRKAVLYVSSGVPMIAGGELFAAVTAKFEGTSAMSELRQYDASRDFEELGRHANTYGVTFHTMDAGGLRANPGKSAEIAGFDDPRISQSMGSELEANFQSPLVFMADETGGRAILNRNEVVPALDEIIDDLKHYYSLGYMAGHAGDGRFYSIEVKLPGKEHKKLQVRHREGYRDQSTKTKMIDATKAALYHPYQENPLGIEVAVGQWQKDGKDRYIVPVQFRIPVAKLVLMPRETLHQLSLRLYVAAIDEHGDISAVEETPLGLRIPNEHAEAAMKESWLYTHRVALRKGPHKIAFGLRDEFGAEESFLSATVRVGE